MINILPGVETTAAALNAERIRMDVVGQNIANANVTRGLDGRPYQRQQVVFESVLNRAVQTGRGAASVQAPLVQVARIQPDTAPPRLVYNPGHPDADGNGMVAMPDISVHEEMVDLISASRAFEANLSVLKTARSMAMQSLSIGKR